MKVLIVDKKRTYSGIERYVLCLHSALMKLVNEEVEMLALDTGPDDLLQEKAQNRLLFYPQEFVKIIDHLILLFRATRVDYNYDVYHIPDAILGLLARRFHPCVVTVHDLLPLLLPHSLTDFGIKKSMEQLVYADRVICVSERTKADLMRSLEIDPRTVSVIHSGLDHDLFRPRDKNDAKRSLGFPKDKVLILNVGCEKPTKNITTLIKAFHKLVKNRPDVLLIRIGTRSLAVQKLINRLGLENKVTYLRPKDKELASLYNASDALVFPSYYEGWGLPLLEAMASGCPVIAGNRSAVPEAVGNAGILLDPFDVEAFAYSMLEILTKEDLRTELSQRGYERSTNFSWEKCAVETLEVYRDILENLRRSS